LSLNRTLVIRFGALGDLCICGWFLSGLKKSDKEISLLTKTSFSELALEFSGVDKVVAPDLSNIFSASSSIDMKSYHTIIDAHSVLRSKLLTLLGGKSTSATLSKDTFSRFDLIARARFGLKQQDKPVTHLLDRYCDLSNNIIPSAPLAHFSTKSSDSPIAIAPGAMWESKQWPVDNFTTVVEQLLYSGKNIRLFIGPKEKQWFQESTLAKITNDNLEIINNQSLLKVAKLLGNCSCTITNDSGLLHLSETTNTPVVAMFGPTVKQFGYFPLLKNSKVIEHNISCRPCSRAGKRDCWRGDLACLTKISTDTVLKAVGEF
jgi:heptosyltransferase II